MRFFYFLVACLIFCSCEYLESGAKSSKKKSNVLKQYRSDGSLKNEIEVENGKRNGLAKSYYKNGKLQQVIFYVNDIKHGDAITYYKTGQKYMETPYDSGKMHGVRKKYRQNGKLLAEIPYFQGKETAGLKEYLLDGSEKTQYPEIKIKVVDKILLNNKYTLKLSVTNASRKIQYFLGKLDDKKRVPLDALPLSSTKPGEAEVEYYLIPGTFVMEELNIIALVTTKLGNPFITETSFNVAIENRGI